MTAQSHSNSHKNRLCPVKWPHIFLVMHKLPSSEQNPIGDPTVCWSTNLTLQSQSCFWGHYGTPRQLTVCHRKKFSQKAASCPFGSRPMFEVCPINNVPINKLTTRGQLLHLMSQPFQVYQTGKPHCLLRIVPVRARSEIFFSPFSFWLINVKSTSPPTHTLFASISTGLPSHILPQK